MEAKSIPDGGGETAGGDRRFHGLRLCRIHDFGPEKSDRRAAKNQSRPLSTWEAPCSSMYTAILHHRVFHFVRTPLTPRAGRACKVFRRPGRRSSWAASPSESWMRVRGARRNG